MPFCYGGGGQQYLAGLCSKQLICCLIKCLNFILFFFICTAPCGNHNGFWYYFSPQWWWNSRIWHTRQVTGKWKQHILCTSQRRQITLMSRTFLTSKCMGIYWGATTKNNKKREEKKKPKHLTLLTKHIAWVTMMQWIAWLSLHMFENSHLFCSEFCFCFCFCFM